MVTTRSDTMKRKKAEEEEVKSKRMKKDGQERRIKAKKSTGNVKNKSGAFGTLQQQREALRARYSEFFDRMVESWIID